MNSHSQLCTGSLGDPVVNITFGNGADPTNTAYAPPNTYAFTYSTCPNDGQYTITRQTSNCFNNTWHTVTADHTGNGAFMLVNASLEPGDFFLATVTDLCPNTTYEFAAWIMNVLRTQGIRPNVTFSIEQPDGTLLGKISTGDISETPQPTWRQYGLYFTTPASNATIVLRIKNNAPGGGGNDLGLDDITFRPCGGKIDVNVVGHTDTIDRCEGNTEVFAFQSNVNGYVSPVFFWQLSTDDGGTWTDIPGANTPDYIRQPTGNGRYLYRLSVTESTSAGLRICRIASNIITVNIHADPIVDAGPDRTLIKGDPITIRASVNGEQPVFSWAPPDYLSATNILQPVASPPAEMIYTLTATTSYGCIGSDDVKVRVINGIYIPTAFTPNGDGKNDVWRVPQLDPEWLPEVNVYNRYGQVVYHATGASLAWDGTLNGKKQPSDVYVYVLTLHFSNLLMKGTVTLIR